MNRDWMDDAACRYTDPDIFFPKEEESAPRMVYRAKRVCRSCPVLAECSEYVLNHPMHNYGVWAAMSESERRRLRRKRGLTAYAGLSFHLTDANGRVA